MMPVLVPTGRLLRSLGRGLVLALASLAAAAGAQPAATLTLAHVGWLSPLTTIQQRVVSEACRRAGLAVAYQALPPVRSMESANSGKIDGDLYRIADVTQIYPNLMLVPTPVGRVDVAVYGGTPAIATLSREQIASLRFTAARGVLVLKKHAKDLTLTEARDFEATWNMVRGGRVDALIAAYLDTEIARDAGLATGLHLWPHRWASEPLFLC